MQFKFSNSQSQYRVHMRVYVAYIVKLPSHCLCGIALPLKNRWIQIVTCICFTISLFSSFMPIISFYLVSSFIYNLLNLTMLNEIYILLFISHQPTSFLLHLNLYDDFKTPKINDEKLFAPRAEKSFLHARYILLRPRRLSKPFW